jgi:hypothetical protein
MHYQLKKVDVDGGEKFEQFGCLNFHAKQGEGWGGETNSGHQEQMVHPMEKSMVLLQGAHACAQGEKVMYVLH